MAIARRPWFLGFALVLLLALALAACGDDDDGGDGLGLDTDYPPAGEDRFENTRATVEIEVTLPGVAALPFVGQVETVVLEGPMLVLRSDPQDADGDGLVDIETEIVEMTLTGTSSFGPIEVRLNPERPSMGQVEQQEPGQDTPADSFFDIFLLVEILEIGLVGFNDEAITMEAVLIEFPPGFLDQYEGALALPTPLLSVDSEEEFARILDALHVPNPPPEDGEPPEATPTPTPTPTPAPEATPTPTPAPTEPPPPAGGLTGTRQCDIEVRTDVAGHEQFVGMPPVLILDFHQADSTIDIMGPPPWVDLTGTIQNDVTIVATGMGIVAGFPDIQVDYNGFVKGSTVDAVLTMGGGGGLPQGQPINYQVTCP